MMADPFAELPLAIFTALMPLSAGAFLTIAAAILVGNLKESAVKALDRMTIIPIAVMMVGVIASFFHLTAPLNSIHILSGLGRSPLSNEIAVTVLFAVAAIAYLAIALSGKASASLRKGLLGLIAILGLAQSVFTGLAYSIETIPGWATFWAPLQQIGYMLMGSVVGLLAANLAQADGSEKFRKIGSILVICGVLVALVSNAAHIMQVSGMASELVSGATLASAAMPYALAALACGIAGAACCLFAGRKDARTALYGAATVLILVSVLCGRLAFYCLQLGIGL